MAERPLPCGRSVSLTPRYDVAGCRALNLPDDYPIRESFQTRSTGLGSSFLLSFTAHYGGSPMPYETVNPATGEHLATYPEHTPEQVESALALADRTYRAWRKLSFVDRGAVISRAADIFRERAEQLSKLVTLEMGKLISESRAEVQLTADILSYYADNAETFLAPVEMPQREGKALVVSQPIGVLFGIEPWNFPYYQLVRFAAPNLMGGNTVIVKHAPSVPQCAEAFAQVFLDAGAPQGVYTNLRLSDEQAGVVIADARIQGVAVTGSDRAGSSVASQAGKAMKRSTMELGGSDPFIVLDDADLEEALKWAVWSRLLNCGQGCVCAKRFIVADSIYDQFVEGVKQKLLTQRIGDPMLEDTQLGPLASAKAKELLLDQVNRAVKGGATLAVGGTSIERAGSYFEPAILENVLKGNPAYTEEFFGPVFLMFRFTHDEQATQIANDSPYGLASAVFSRDSERAGRIAREIEAGMVFINHPAWTAPDLPFGGVKQSGYGRELSSLGIQEFMNKKLIRTQAAVSVSP